MKWTPCPRNYSKSFNIVICEMSCSMARGACRGEALAAPSRTPLNRPGGQPFIAIPGLANRAASHLSAGPSGFGAGWVVCSAHGQGVASEPAIDKGPKKRLAVFVSGGGSNFKAIHAACLDGRIHGEVVVVVSDKASCGGVDYAKVRTFGPSLARTLHEERCNAGEI